jgi:hypothetical protein
MVTDSVPNRQILARRMASEACKRKLEIELTTQSYPSLEVLKGSLAGAERGSQVGTARPDGQSVRDLSATGTD